MTEEVRRSHPGPVDRSVLHMQEDHTSESIWNHKDEKVLKVRRAQGFHHEYPPKAIHTYLKSAGFMGLALTDYTRVDHGLITALVERWRPETHTFHLPPGETTITLQDVGVLLGLPIDGKVVAGPSVMSWESLARQFLGIKLPQDDKVIRGGRINMKWLEKQFGKLQEGADTKTIKRYARQYILRLIGGVLFPDYSGVYVHLMHLYLLRDLEEAGKYSWGSACLAYLYRELCKASKRGASEIGGCSMLLQLWAWERVPKIAPALTPPSQDEIVADAPHGRRWCYEKNFKKTPRYVLKQYRFILDRLRTNEIIWQPYSPDVVKQLPAICTGGSHIWTSVVPMIHYAAVEWHQPDRVIRQFGLEQGIPNQPSQVKAVHYQDMRGKSDVDWERQHSKYIEMWNNRGQHCVVGYTSGNLHLTKDSEYMKWYRSITRRFITPMGGALHQVADEALSVLHMCSTAQGASSLSLDTIKEAMESILVACDDAEYEVFRPSDNYMPEAAAQPPPSHVQHDGEIRGGGDVDTEGALRHRRRRRHTGPSSSVDIPSASTSPYVPSMETPSSFPSFMEASGPFTYNAPPMDLIFGNDDTDFFHYSGSPSAYSTSPIAPPEVIALPHDNVETQSTINDLTLPVEGPHSTQIDVTPPRQSRFGRRIKEPMCGTGHHLRYGDGH